MELYRTLNFKIKKNQLKWPNSSINAKKIFPLGEGVGGGGWGLGGEEGSEEGSEEKSCENFQSILTFSREKSVSTKVVPYDARSLALA